MEKNAEPPTPDIAEVARRSRGFAKLARSLVTVEASLLARAVGIADPGGVSVVGPLALDLPLSAVTERDQRDIESPRAFIPILLAPLVIPGARVVGISASFGEFMSADIG